MGLYKSRVIWRMQGPRSVFLLGGLVTSKVVRRALPLGNFESTTLENAIVGILRNIGGMLLSKKRKKKIKSSKIYNGGKIIGGAIAPQPPLLRGPCNMLLAGLVLRLNYARSEQIVTDYAAL